MESKERSINTSFQNSQLLFEDKKQFNSQN